MKILYIGDVMGEVGVEVVEQLLPELITQHRVDLVIAQAENVTGGKGLSIEDYMRLKVAGINAFTSGNWTLHRSETNELLEDENIPVTRPANYPEDTPGKRYKVVEVNDKKVLLLSLLGSIVGKDADKPMDNPLKVADEIVAEQIQHVDYVIVNFHGDFSSEKRVIGYYLDGRITAVIGDHWHIPTADEMILPKGTAHITDVGMTGSLDSSLGVKFDSIVPRWRDGIQTKNELETEGRRQINAVLVETSPDSITANSITRIQKYI